MIFAPHKKTETSIHNWKCRASSHTTDTPWLTQFKATLSHIHAPL